MIRLSHASPAIHTLGLDHWTHGAGLLREIFRRWGSLDITQVGSIVAIVSTAPVAWRLLHSAWVETAAWVRHFFVATVTIPANDPINRGVGKWMLTHVVDPRGDVRFFTARTEVTARDMATVAGNDRVSGLKRTRRAMGLHPHWERRWFWHSGSLFVVSKTGGSNLSASFTADPSYDGVGGEELTISCFGRSVTPIRSLIDACRDWADRQTQFFVVIYARDRYGMSWQPKGRMPIRRLDTVHFDRSVKEQLLADINNYLDPKTQRRYQSRSMPYRRGYLFYGPPGTGKSSLTTALAGEFGLDLYEVKIPSVASDGDLEQMFAEIPPRCIVLLEDIDAVWMAQRRDTASLDTAGTGSTQNNRLKPDSDTHSTGGYSSHAASSSCTLSGLLNVLDGVGSSEGRIVVMTTNKPEMLDPALTRPGRVDMKVFLGNISRMSARDMFVRMFSPDVVGAGRADIEPVADTADGAMVDMTHVHALASEFAEKIPEDTFTPSQLQGFFQLHLDSPDTAAASIQAWVARSGRREGDYEFVVQPVSPQS